MVEGLLTSYWGTLGTAYSFFSSFILSFRMLLKKEDLLGPCFNSLLRLCFLSICFHFYQLNLSKNNCEVSAVFFYYSNFIKVWLKLLMDKPLAPWWFGMPAFWVWFEFWFCCWYSFLSILYPGRQWWHLAYEGPCHSLGRPRFISRLSVLAWPSLGDCRYLGSEPARSLYLCAF